MKIAVYALYAYTWYDPERLVGIYSSEAKARSRCKSRAWKYRIERIIVDE